MRKLFIALFLLTAISASFADSRVFPLVNPHPEEVLQALRNTYGDKIGADVVRGKLVIVGSKQQLDEVAALLVKLDPAPRALRLQLSEQPPADTNPDTITYSTDSGGYTIDTVEGALVAIDYQKISRQPSGQGWWVTINNVPTQINAVTLQVRIHGGRRALVLVNYTKEENQERRVFGNTVTGDLGTWISLLPRPVDTDDNVISSGPKRDEQLYLRVDKKP